jgi:hypothetical protein
MSGPLVFDAQRGLATLGGQSLVFHCHFYNCALQRAIESGLGDEARVLLRDAAIPPVRKQLLDLVGSDIERALQLGPELFCQLGFGTVDLAGVGAKGGTAVVLASHYAMGWVVVHGRRQEPACRFVEGFIAATLSVAYDLAPDRVRVQETECYACEAESCRFSVEVA